MSINHTYDYVHANSKLNNLSPQCASLWFTYFLLYMQKVAGFSDRNAAILMLLGQVLNT